MAQTIQEDPVSNLLSEFGARLNEIEEKHRLLKDRVMLVGENLISTKEEHEKESLELKKKINEIEYEIKTLKQLNKRILDELSNFARKSELNIIKRQLDMFNPLIPVTKEEVKRIFEEEIKKNKFSKV